MSVAITLLIALALDALLGEPKKWHPLVGFGHWATKLEKCFILPSDAPNIYQKFMGTLALLLAIFPISISIYLLTQHTQLNILLSPLLLYLCIAPKSLRQHTMSVYHSLQARNLTAARHAISRIVSRETQQMDFLAIRKATIETTLENGADAIFAPIFWFIIAGPTGVIFYRLSNTLDAMWGYKNPRYLHFGFAAARLDDVLNWIPARLTALSYGLLGHKKTAWQCYRKQSLHCESPNAGIVMSAGAGSLQVKLGGVAVYHGEIKHKPLLGSGYEAVNQDILRTNLLISLSIGLWVIILSLGDYLA